MSDFINGLFEFFGGMISLLNVYQLHKDKQIRGVSILPTIFFTSWAIWNAAWYYPHLNQWFSFGGGLLIGAVNGTWLFQIIYYRYVKDRTNDNGH